MIVSSKVDLVCWTGRVGVCRDCREALTTGDAGGARRIRNVQRSKAAGMPSLQRFAPTIRGTAGPFNDRCSSDAHSQHREAEPLAYPALTRNINDKAAFRRPVRSNSNTKRNLERAKGLEPSTPTLARSCSTTELHPHPRWRRTLAVNGRPMPNADRECNSPRAIRCHADNPISLTNGSESVGNNA